MIFIELIGGKSRKFHLEFHPYMTVVDGFGARQRFDMTNRLTKALSGHDVGFEFSVDIDGSPEPLNEQSAERVGFDASAVDNVVTVEDIPGVAFYVEDEDYRPADANDPEGRLGAARAELAEAEREAAIAASRMEAAERPVQRIDDRVLEQLYEAHEQVRHRVGELREKVNSDPSRQNTPEQREDRRNRMVSIEAAIENRIKELRSVLSSPEAIRGWARSAGPEVAGQLTKEWAEVNERLQNVRPRAQAPHWLVVQSRNDVKLARERVQDLMVRLGNNEDVFTQLEAARGALRDFESVWLEVESSTRDEVAELQARRAAIFDKANGLAGRELDADEVGQVLEGLANAPQQEPDTNDTVDDPFASERRDLAAALLDLRDVRRDIVGIDNEPVTQPTPEDQERVGALLEQLREAEERERELGERLAELQVAARQPRPVNPDALELVRRNLSAARDRLVNAQRQVDYFETMAPRARGPKRRPVSPEDDDKAIEIDMSGVDPEQLERYLLSRAAQLRNAGNGKAIPMILDAALDHLPDHTMFSCLSALMRVASVVQVIYMAGDRTPVEWADRQDEMRVAVTRLEVV